MLLLFSSTIRHFVPQISSFIDTKYLYVYDIVKITSLI